MGLGTAALIASLIGTGLSVGGQQLSKKRAREAHEQFALRQANRANDMNRLRKRELPAETRESFDATRTQRIDEQLARVAEYDAAYEDDIQPDTDSPTGKHAAKVLSSELDLARDRVRNQAEMGSYGYAMGEGVLRRAGVDRGINRSAHFMNRDANLLGSHLRTASAAGRPLELAGLTFGALGSAMGGYAGLAKAGEIDAALRAASIANISSGAPAAAGAATSGAQLSSLAYYLDLIQKGWQGTPHATPR